jgi:hypothetical protein
MPQYSGFTLDFVYLESRTPKPAESKLKKSSQKASQMIEHLEQMEDEYKKVQGVGPDGFQDPRYIEREMELEEDIDTYKKKVDEAILQDHSIQRTDFEARRKDFKKAEKAGDRKRAQDRKEKAKKEREYLKQKEKERKDYLKEKEKDERETKRQQKIEKKERQTKLNRDPRNINLKKAKKSKNIPEIVKIMRQDAKKQEVPVISDKVRQGKPDGEMVMYKDTEYEVMFDEEYNLFVLLSDEGDLEFYLDPTI